MRAALRYAAILGCVAACASGARNDKRDESPDSGAGVTTGGTPATGGTGAPTPPPGTGGTAVPTPPIGDDDAGGAPDTDAALGDASTDAGDGTGFTDVPFWLEAWEPGSRAVLWVKVDINAGDSLDLVLRYGDASLESASDIDSVFEFADDFSGSALDTTKWTVDDMTGWSVSGGSLHGADTTGRIRSKATFTSNTAPIVAEARFKATTLPTNGFMPNGFYQSASVGFGLLANVNYHVRNNAAWDGPHTWAGSYIADWARAVARMKSGAQAEMTLARDSDGANLVVHPFAYTVSGLPLTLGKRYDDTNPAQAYAAAWDFIFVRKWVATEPTVDIVDDDEPNGECDGCFDKTIAIDNGSGGALDGHQVRIALDAGATMFWSHARATGADLRIVLP